MGGVDGLRPQVVANILRLQEPMVFDGVVPTDPTRSFLDVHQQLIKGFRMGRAEKLLNIIAGRQSQLGQPAPKSKMVREKIEKKIE